MNVFCTKIQLWFLLAKSILHALIVLARKPHKINLLILHKDHYSIGAAKSSVYP